MKVSQLKENIRNIVRKKMDEANALVTTKTGTKPVDYKNTTELTKLKSDPNVSSIETTAGQKLKEEAGKYTAAAIDKMSRAELIDFLGLDRAEARNWSDKQLFGAARELADDKPMDESDTGDQPISSMSRADLLKHFNLPSNTSEDEYSDEDLRDALSGLDEADYIDDDDVVVNEDVEDVDSSGDEMAKYYDRVYEAEMTDGFEANVAPGSVYQLSVEPHPTRPNLIILSQDNGQKVVVNVEDINSLINILRELA